MLNNLLSTIRRYDMVQEGETVICAVSGGADSMALLWAMYLLKEKLGIALCAAHFNHHLRGEESDRDASFVQAFCRQFEIPLFVGGGQVIPGEKGLEAAARNARYRYFEGLPGKIATAHTADDNAETVLMHLVRGTGLRGLGGIVPVSGRVIRPMLDTTRQQVLAFLQEYHIRFVEDSSNGTDAFLRNRIRHHVMPVLTQENPQFAKSLSATAQRLRQDEQQLSNQAAAAVTTDVSKLRQMPQGQLHRVLGLLLQQWGVPEPDAEHIRLVHAIVEAEKPSAWVSLPGGIIVERCYDRLQKRETMRPFEPVQLKSPGVTKIPELGLQVTCTPGCPVSDKVDRFTVSTQGAIWLRPRQEGDTMRLWGGSKPLKKLFIDRKIPASQRPRIPVAADEKGVLGVYGIGPNLDRLSDLATELHFEALQDE